MDVRITVPVPSEAAAYSGKMAYRLSVPFAEGVLKGTDGVVVVDRLGNPVAADVQWTARWRPPSWSGVKSVRWLLVTFLADIDAGTAADYWLRFGTGVANASFVAPPPTPHTTTGDALIDTGTISLSIGPTAGMLGSFILTTDVDGDIALDGATSVVLEKQGAVESIYRIDSSYGGVSGHEASTRFYFYQGLSFVRVVHTMIWNEDDSKKIEGLRFDRTVAGATDGEYGFTQPGVYDPTGAATGKQVDEDTTLWNEVDSEPGTLDGWLNVTGSGDPLFLGLQDASTAFPAGFGYAAGVASVLFFGPPLVSPLGLGLTDVAAPAVAAAQPDPFTPNSQYGGGGFGYEISVPSGGGSGTSDDPADASPRGTAFTWEMTLWFGDAGITPATKNAFVQRPLLAFIDPAFAAQANVSWMPMRARFADQFVETELAISREIGFTTKYDRTIAERARDGLLGKLYLGNFPWQYTGTGFADGTDGWVTYRYWANMGKGSSALLWLQWLRTGDVDLLRFAKQNARVTSDMCVCHVRELGQYADESHAADWKFRGGTYSYGENWYTFGPCAGAAASEVIDDEGLLLAYYMTGDERIRDVIRERIVATKYSRWGVPTTGPLDLFYPQDASIVTTSGRDLYNMLRVLTMLYEYAWDDLDPDVESFLPTLKDWAERTLSTVLFAQDEAFVLHGAYWFGGITSPHYLDHSLIVAANVFESAATWTALDRWQAYIGRPSAPGVFSGQAYQNFLWALVEEWRRAPTQALVDDIDGTLRAEADTILRAPIAFSGRTFQGEGPYFGNDIGPVVRSQIAAMWVVAKTTPSNVGLRQPFAYASANLFVSGTTWRSIIFLKKPTTAALSVKVHLNGFNSGAVVGSEIPVDVVRWNPDLSNSTTSFSYLATFFHTWGLEHVTITLAGGTAAGLYAFEIKTTAPISRALPARLALSGPGQVVHYVPLGMGSSYYVAIQAIGAGGEAWLKPEASTTVRVQSYEPGIGRAVLLDAAGAVLDDAEVDHLTGGTPVYAELSFAAGGSPAAIRLSTGEQQPNRLFQAAGFRPYLAPTLADLFDPNVENAALVAALSLPNV